MCKLPRRKPETLSAIFLVKKRVPFVKYDVSTETRKKNQLMINQNATKTIFKCIFLFHVLLEER